MKKFISTLLLCTLASCGGGGNSAVPTGYNYAAHNGKYICTNPERTIFLESKFQEMEADLTIDVSNSEKYTVTYKDVVWKTNDRFAYTKYLNNNYEVETVILFDINRFFIVIGPKKNLEVYYTSSEFICSKIQ